MRRLPERNPKILTTKKFQKVYDEMESLQGRVAEYEELDQFIEIAKDLRAAAEMETHTGQGNSDLLAAAMENAKKQLYDQLIREYAASRTAELKEEERNQIRKEFLLSEKARIDREVAEEVAKSEAYRRLNVAREVEAEFRQKGREALLAEIDSDEASKTRQRLASLAIQEANQEALIKELQLKAERSHGVSICDIPTQTVVSVGLSDKQGASFGRLEQCDRIIKLRILEPEEAIMEVLDDSWVASKDNIRRFHSLPDLAMLSMHRHSNGHTQPNFSLDVSPMFVDENQEHVPMYGLEAKILTIADKKIF